MTRAPPPPLRPLVKLVGTHKLGTRVSLTDGNSGRHSSVTV